MAKCVKCGKSFLTRGRIKLADADICFKCFDDLGFDHKTGIYNGSLYKWEDICDGWDAYMLKQHKERIKEQMIEEIANNPQDYFKVANYGQLRDVDATDEELEMFEVIKQIVDAEDIQLVRKSDSYVTAVIGEWDIARFKFTDRAKWIALPVVEVGNKKNRIERVEDVNQYSEQLINSLAHIRKYS